MLLGRLLIHEGVSREKVVNLLCSISSVALDYGQVLEAINGRLYHNRQLHPSETQETTKSYPLFRPIFPGGYGGLEPFSRAFRNRFLEVDVYRIFVCHFVDPSNQCYVCEDVWSKPMSPLCLFRALVRDASCGQKRE